MKRSSAIVLTFVLLFSGCAGRQKTVTNLPPGVTQAQVNSWDSAVANLNKMAVSVSAVRQLVISLNKQGTFPDGAPYAVTLRSIGQINQLEIASVDYLKTVPNSWSTTTATTIKANMDTILAQIQTLNAEGVTGIKDQNSLTQVNTLITEITSLTNIVLSLATGS